MINTFMLLLAFTVTDPAGFDRDEKFHVLSRHFITQELCEEFVQNWEDRIKTEGLAVVQNMLAKGWEIRMNHIGCTKTPNLK